MLIRGIGKSSQCKIAPNFDPSLKSVSVLESRPIRGAKCWQFDSIFDLELRRCAFAPGVRKMIYTTNAMNGAMQTQAKITEPMVPLRALPAFGGYGLDRACCTASVGHQGIDGGVRLMPGPTTIPPSQKSLTQNI
jgi:hypothetical protein